MNTITLTKTAARLFPSYAKLDTVAPLLLSLARFAAQRPGLEFGNYCRGWNDADGRRAYFAESRQIARQFGAIALEMRSAVWIVTDADLRAASARVFSGRLQFTESGAVDYCTGQYWPTEYRRAALTVLCAAIGIASEREAKAA